MKASGISSGESAVITAALATFCRTAGRACYGSYSPEVLQDYLAFHIGQNTLAWVREGQRAPGEWLVTGCAVAWQCEPEDLFCTSLTNRSVFNWQPSNPLGRCLFIADVVATTPRAMSALLTRFALRFPDWKRMPIYTFRHGRMVYVTARTLARMWRQQHQRILGGH